MAAITDGGPAFPQPPCPDCGVRHEPAHVPGMSLRDYFAAATISRIQIDNDEEVEDQPTEEMIRWVEWQAAYAYALADAMLKAREQTTVDAGESRGVMCDDRR